MTTHSDDYELLLRQVVVDLEDHADGNVGDGCWDLYDKYASLLADFGDPIVGAHTGSTEDYPDAEGLAVLRQNSVEFGRTETP